MQLLVLVWGRIAWKVKIWAVPGTQTRWFTRFLHIQGSLKCCSQKIDGPFRYI